MFVTPMIEDVELLRRYAVENSEPAFAELVRRRVDLVYSVALRQVGGDAQFAEDVTQRVFTALARKAPELLARPVLSGWLYRAAQFAATDIVRAERRRRAREQETYCMQEIIGPAEPPTNWDRLRPLLDRALSELDDADRDAVALRFFERRPFADIGRTLRLTEEAARKRVDRALDKLAAILSRSGVTSTAAAVAAALAQQGMIAAPAGLAASVTGSALSGAAAAGATAAAGGMLAALGSMKATLAAGVITAAAVATAVHEYRVAGDRATEAATLRQREQHTAAQLAAEQGNVRSAEQRAAEAEADTEKLLVAIQADSVTRAAASPGAASAEPLTQDSVQARYRRAQQLARTGDPAEALRELLWCYDTGMPPVTGFGGVRFSFLLSDIASLGKKYPPALAALRERRDQAERQLLASPTDFEAVQAFSALNKYLQDDARTIAIFDQLPADDRRRTNLARSAFDTLRELQRYTDAAEGTTFALMQQRFEMSTAERPLPAGIAQPERLRAVQRNYAIGSAAKFVEVLAGSGQLQEARALAERVLAFDASAGTRELLQTHAARAGQPDLLGATRAN